MRAPRRRKGLVTKRPELKPLSRTGWSKPPAPPAPEPPSQAALALEALLRSLCGQRRLLRVEGDARRIEVVLPSGDAVELDVRAGYTARERSIAGERTSPLGAITTAPDPGPMGPVVDPDGDPSTLGAALDAGDRARKVAKGE